MLTGLMIVLLSVAALAGPKKKNEGKWIDLFDGKDMTGWRMAGKGSFTVSTTASCLTARR